MGQQYRIPAVRMKGLRSQPIPAGYVLGRLSPGNGETQLINIAALSQYQVASGIVQKAGASSAAFVDLGVYFQGGLNTFLPGQYWPLAYVSQATLFPSASKTQVATCLTAASSNTAKFYLTDSISDFAANGSAGSHTVGSVTFAANSLTGTWALLHNLTVPEQTQFFLVTDLGWAETVIAGITMVFVGDAS